jgi:cell division protein FtsW (lipid II flippase)
MKKFVLLSVAALMIASLAVGCSSNGTSSWCRSGSLFPTARSKATQTVYTTSAQAQQCDPCTPSQ